MNYNQEYILLAEQIIKTSPGYKGNEDLLEEMVNQTLNQAQNLLESSSDTSVLEMYIKRIAENVLVNTIKNADALRMEKQNKILIKYKTDNKGKIKYDIEIPEFLKKKK